MESEGKNYFYFLKYKEQQPLNDMCGAGWKHMITDTSYFETKIENHKDGIKHLQELKDIAKSEN